MRNRGPFEDKQRQTLTGVITGLMGALGKLAPHPDQPNYHGPLFIQNNANLKMPGEHDGMLGMMMLESMLGSAFAEAASETFGDWTDNIDATNLMESYSAYITDIESHARNTAAHGQGTLARLSGKSISGAFNMRSEISEALQAFYDDLPERLRIEKDLAHYARQLALLDAPAHRLPAPAVAA